MASLNVSLEIDNKAYLSGIRAADAATKQFGRDAAVSGSQAEVALNRLNATSERLATSFGRLKGLIVGAAFGALTRGAISSADAISDLSAATELSIGRIIELQAALAASGGEAANAGKLVTEFYKSIDEAAQGSDKTQESFGRLGVSLRDLGTLSTADLLDKTIKGFENITDPAQRTAMAIQLFGKSMAGVSASDLAGQMSALRGQFEQQTRAVEQAAKLNDNFVEAMNNVRLAFLTITAPLVEFINNISKSRAELQSLITILTNIAIVLAAVFGMTVLGKAATIIGGIGRGIAAMTGGFTAFSAKVTSIFAASSAFMTGLRAAAKLIGFIGGGALAAVGLSSNSTGTESTTGSTQPGTMDAYVSRERKETPAARPVETGKELAGQLNTVNSLADGYRRAAQANMDRMTTEQEILGLNREEAETIKGIADINKRYADQVLALEDKKKGAKGATLGLINKEIANLEGLRTSEIDIFEITRERTIQYARQQQEIKNIIDLMEQQAEYAREIAGFETQQGAAVVTAFEQVQAQTQALALTGQREQLEKSIQNLRGSDQESIRALFDLETQRLSQLDAIQKIQNLPFEGVGGMKQRLEEINALYDQRRVQIEATSAATRAEQNSFSAGWQAAGEKFRNNFKTDAEYAAESFKSLTSGLENAFVQFVTTGKISFKGLANSMIADFARIQAQKALAGMFGGGGGGSGNFLSTLGSFFGGSYANGGMPPVGVPSVVGERGPELFVPQSAGRVVPNHALGGSNTVNNNNTAVTYSIQAVDAQSFKSMLARDPEFLHTVAEQGRRSMPIRSRV